MFGHVSKLESNKKQIQIQLSVAVIIWLYLIPDPLSMFLGFGFSGPPWCVSHHLNLKPQYMNIRKVLFQDSNLHPDSILSVCATQVAPLFIISKLITPLCFMLISEISAPAWWYLVRVQRSAIVNFVCRYPGCAVRYCLSQSGDFYTWT